MGGQLVYLGGYNMAKVNLMNQSAYARRRGVSKVAVGKAIKAGRISLVNGLIDPEVADIQWKANSRARASQSEAEQLPLAPPGGSDDPVKPDDYMISRNRREAADAEKAERALALDKQLLIQVAAVNTVWAHDYSATRDALLQIPARLGPQLAAESDPAVAQAMIDVEIRQALQVLSIATSKSIIDSIVPT